MITVPEQMVRRAAGGDRAAFEEIYGLTSAYVYTVALRISGNVEDAQDVAQDVYVRIYRSLKKFNFRSKFTTWIYRITVNTAIDKYNKSKKIRAHETKNELMLENSGIAVNVTEEMEKEEGEEKVMELLNRLNPGQRACMLLRETEQLSYKEISDVLKVNINTVKTRLKRARKILMKYVPKKEAEYEMR